MLQTRVRLPYNVDMDLEKFFDTVNQSKFIEILSRDIKDGRRPLNGMLGVGEVGR